MFRNMAIKYLLVVGSALVAGFFLLTYLFDPSELTVILNGIYAGSVITVMVAYWRLLLHTVSGEEPYDKVDHLAMGFLLIWIAYSVSAGTSIYLRATGYEPVNTYFTAGHRYVAIVACWFQVTAPDFGYGLFYGRDRKLLIGGAVIGVILAALIIYAQDYSILAYDYLFLALA